MLNPSFPIGSVLSRVLTAGNECPITKNRLRTPGAAVVFALLAGCSTTQSIPSTGLANAHIVDQTSIGYATKGKNNRSGKTVWIQQPMSLPGPVVASVTTSPVKVRRQFDATPYDPAHVAVGERIPGGAPDNLSDWVLVSGNYTPKGVYTRPDAGSRILTRVAPGARLRLEDSFDGWMKVDTEQGIGYLQAIDARILSAQNDAGPRVVFKPQNTQL